MQHAEVQDGDTKMCSSSQVEHDTDHSPWELQDRKVDVVLVDAALASAMVAALVAAMAMVAVPLALAMVAAVAVAALVAAQALCLHAGVGRVVDE